MGRLRDWNISVKVEDFGVLMHASCAARCGANGFFSNQAFFRDCIVIPEIDSEYERILRINKIILLSHNVSTNCHRFCNTEIAARCVQVLCSFRRPFGFIGRGFYKLGELQLQRDFQEVFDIAKIICGTRVICMWELIKKVISLT